ncbi:hypothetical protein [Bradyrhizobium cosmicum]|uniref:hypothetical protein n=1 Tax=Bradyrhizobium cosmicum TaxID=1404864 RepID=UPI0016431E03|nr:hypothetical protein [Bradyrhizobium cosmicum]
MPRGDEEEIAERDVVLLLVFIAPAAARAFLVAANLYPSFFRKNGRAMASPQPSSVHNARGAPRPRDVITISRWHWKAETQALQSAPRKTVSGKRPDGNRRLLQDLWQHHDHVDALLEDLRRDNGKVMREFVFDLARTVFVPGDRKQQIAVDFVESDSGEEAIECLGARDGRDSRLDGLIFDEGQFHHVQ